MFLARAPVPLLLLAGMPGWHACEGPRGTLGLCFRFVLFVTSDPVWPAWWPSDLWLLRLGE